MTLSGWFREYVYIPLGGNRSGVIRQIFNLLVVWFLTGLWHGAGWNFILWGLYFFVLLLAEKLFLLREMEQWPKVCRRLYTLFFVVVSWAIFACDDIRYMVTYLKAMFGAGVSVSNEIAVYYWMSYILFLSILVLGSTENPKKVVLHFAERLRKKAAVLGDGIIFTVKAVYLLLLLLLCVAFLVSGSYNPFLYFRF